MQVAAGLLPRKKDLFKFGVVTFSGIGLLECPCIDDINLIQSRVDRSRLDNRAGQDYDEGFKTALTALKKVETKDELARSVLIVQTDGQGTTRNVETIRKQGVLVSTFMKHHV